MTAIPPGASGPGKSSKPLISNHQVNKQSSDPLTENIMNACNIPFNITRNLARINHENYKNRHRATKEKEDKADRVFIRYIKGSKK